MKRLLIMGSQEKTSMFLTFFTNQGFHCLQIPSDIEAYIRNISDKLRAVGFPIDLHLVTVWGVGYRWDRLDNLRNVKIGGGGSVV